jgi:hypothetical protein
MKNSYREQVIRARFPPRACLSPDQLWADFFSDLPQSCVRESLHAFQVEFRLDPGFLRPDDSLTALFAPVRTRNPWRWLSFRSIESDGVGELAHALTKRLDAMKAPKDVKLSTFGDFVRAWCGVLPATGADDERAATTE